MKKNNLHLKLIILLLSAFSSVKAQNFTYELTVKDINTVTINQPNDAVEFSIYLRNTSTNQPCDFVYSAGQYFFTFNPAIASSSSDLVYTRIQSDLPSACQPVNPTVGVSGNPDILGMAGNMSIGRAASPIIPVTPPNENGVLIERMRLRRISGTLNPVPLNLEWKFPPGYQTMLAVFGPDCISDNAIMITNHSNHFTEKVVDLRYSLEGMYPNLVLDNIKVYLANSTAPYQIIDSSILLSQLDGSKFKALPSFKKAVSGKFYYIVVRHRNSIETWSKNPVTFTSNTISYDFTTSANMAFGDNMKQVSASPDCFAFYSGDVNQDGAVDINDMAMIDNDALNYVSGYVNTDLNGDNFVDLGDMTFADNNSFYYVGWMRP